MFAENCWQCVWASRGRWTTQTAAGTTGSCCLYWRSLPNRAEKCKLYCRWCIGQPVPYPVYVTGYFWATWCGRLASSVNTELPLVVQRQMNISRTIIISDGTSDGSAVADKNRCPGDSPSLFWNISFRTVVPCRPATQWTVLWSRSSWFRFRVFCMHFLN